jgi:phosphopantothenoylcysteine decarboxylase/phosphopantothenate--cysteine ligase
VLTEGAEAFVTPLTFATLARYPAYTDRDFWLHTSARPLHIELAEWAEGIVIAPLTANTLAKLAHGLADNLLSNCVLASSCPVLLAPAMNTQMWLASAVQRNWDWVHQDPRFHSIPPTAGRLACDTVGPGRLVEPESLEEALLSMLWTKGVRDWQGKQVLISAGGTREAIDAVRFIGNPASGRMGIALASAAAYRGAQVVLVHGPLGELPMPSHPHLHSLEVMTAAQMHTCLVDHFSAADLLVMAAAVGDVRPLHPVAGKIPKAKIPLALPLEIIPDILQDLSDRKRPRQRIIGFAAQTGDPVPLALRKLHAKQLDAIVANPIDQPDSGFGSPWNQAVWLERGGQQQLLQKSSKTILAHRILDCALPWFAGQVLPTQPVVGKDSN